MSQTQPADEIGRAMNDAMLRIAKAMQDFAEAWRISEKRYPPFPGLSVEKVRVSKPRG